MLVVVVVVIVVVVVVVVVAVVIFLDSSETEETISDLIKYGGGETVRERHEDSCSVNKYTIEISDNGGKVTYPVKHSFKCIRFIIFMDLLVRSSEDVIVFVEDAFLSWHVPKVNRLLSSDNVRPYIVFVDVGSSTEVRNH